MKVAHLAGGLRRTFAQRFEAVCRRWSWLPIREICLFKALYWWGLIIAVWLWSNSSVVKVVYWPREWPPQFQSHFAVYDGCFYLDIASDGYHRGRQECAFYPLWPMLIRCFRLASGADPIVVGLALANGFSFVAWLLFYAIVKRRWGELAAKWALLWLLVFPGSLFYQMIYTESLFLLLSLGLWWALLRGQRGWICIAGFLLPLARPMGVLCIFPIFSHLMMRRFLPVSIRDKGRILGWLRRPRGTVVQARPVVVAARFEQGFPRSAMLLAPIFGWISYLFLMRCWTGNPFEGFLAQRYWGVNAVDNLWNLPKFTTGFISATAWHEHTGSLLDRSIFLLMVWCLPVLWRRDKQLLVWVFAFGVLPAMSGTFSSFTRYASVVFPIFIALSLSLEGRRFCRYGLLTLFVVIHVALVWRYVNFGWAG